MKYIEKFKFRLDDMDQNGELKNESILKILESIAGYHSDAIGYGYCNLADKKLGWILLDWRIEVIRRPIYPEELTITTWGRKMIKCYTYRDFEIRNETGELCIKASSKWTLFDLASGKLAKLTGDIVNSFDPEEITVFEEDFSKMKQPENILSKTDYTIRKNEIDSNGHLHNTCYLNLAYEAMPEDVFFHEKLNNMRISYKKEVKYGETVECRYSYEEEKHFVTIVNKEDENIHAMIQMW